MTGPVRAGAFFIALSRALAAADQERGAPAVSLARRASVRDGVVRLLVLCPGGARGELIFTTVRPRRLGRIARRAFICSPPSTVASFELDPDVRKLIERLGRLPTRVRITGGPTTGRARVLLLAAR